MEIMVEEEGEGEEEEEEEEEEEPASPSKTHHLERGGQADHVTKTTGIVSGT